jgi:hypothetical protein
VVAGAVAAALGLLAVVQMHALVTNDSGPPVELGMASVPLLLREQAPEPDRDLDPYAGYGTWVDVYDFAPSFQGGGTPAVTADAVDDMVRQGVRTVYLQAAQVDERSPGLVVDPGATAELLVRAQRAGMRVVAWYLPRLSDLDQDMRHLEAIADFEVLGHRFDGVAVDIEWTDGVPDHAARSDRLVELSQRLREESGDEVLGAIVLPPVQIEVVNTRYWPGFPWKELAGSYDVWLPMGYWTERATDSGWKDGQRYTDENVRRIRANLEDPDAPVHAIGGIGDELTPEQVEGFVQALTDTDALGGSIYDWATLSAPLREQLAAMAE